MISASELSSQADYKQQAIPLSWRGRGQLALLTALLALLYYQIVAKLVVEWWSDPNYSHGFVIPIVCVWIVWKARTDLANEAAKPSWVGVFMILGALGILVLGALGAELFLSRTSLIFLLAGLVVHFRGLSYFRRILFPWALLFLMVPLPAIVFNQITLPLQFLATRLASSFLALLGVPVLREGNIINLPSLSLDVAEACSGLRSLISLITLAALYGYFFERRNWLRVLLAIIAILVAVVANGVRIMGSGLLGEYWDPGKAEGFFHLFSGWLIFLVSIALLVSLHSVIAFFGRAYELHRKGA